METLQKVFAQSYVDELKEALSYPEQRKKYLGDTFSYDETKTRVLAGIIHPDGLEEKMLAAETEFDAAVILYEAYKDISPLIASSDTFWTYLSHVDLYQYCKRRWPIENENVKEDYIKEHYFISMQSRITRNAIAALWWWVYFSKEDEPGKEYRLTEILFKNYSFRALWFLYFLRIRNGLMGVLDFLYENQDIFDTAFEYKGRYIANYFNRLGSTRELSALPRGFFKQECYKIKDVLYSIRNEADLKRAQGVE